MKKYWNLVLAIIILILTFLYNWYIDQLIDSFFTFALIPSLILFVAYIICLNHSVKKIIKSFTISDLVSIIILVLTGILVFVFPFREAKTKLELEMYEKDRLEIIEMIKNNELKYDDIGNVELPKNYKKVSTSGEVHVYQNNEDGQVISFWIFRGMLSGSVELIYSTGGEKLIRENEDSHPITSVEKLKNNWFYVETDY